MSRIRTIKPEFFRHEDLFDAELQEELPLRLAFISLWTIADREGRFKWRPRSLKSDCLPFDEIDFSRVLDALMSRGFIVKYEVDGEPYGCIPTFTTHQVVNNREAKSILPAPNENNKLTREARVPNASSTRLVHEQGEGKGREQEGKDNSDLRSGADPAPSESDLLGEEDPKKILFSKGLQWLANATGKSERVVRPLIGRMLSEIGGDAHAGVLLGIFRDCKREGKGEPVAWITAMVQGRRPRAGPAPLRRNPDLEAYDMLRQADERNREKQSGDDGCALSALAIFDRRSEPVSGES